MDQRTDDLLPVSLVWQLPVAIGVVHLLLGIALLVWPEASVTVVAVLLGLELVVAGALRTVLAVVERGSEARLLRGVVGVLGVLAGLLVISQPLRSVGVIVVVVAAFWVLWGLAEAIIALTPSAAGHRGPLFLEAALAIGAGAILLAWPGPTVQVLVMVVGIALLLAGLLATWAGWRLRGMVHDVGAEAGRLDRR